MKGYGRLKGELHKHGVIVKNLATAHEAAILFLIPRFTGEIPTYDVVAGRELPRALRGVARGAQWPPSLAALCARDKGDSAFAADPPSLPSLDVSWLRLADSGWRTHDLLFEVGHSNTTALVTI